MSEFLDLKSHRLLESYEELMISNDYKLIKEITKNFSHILLVRSSKRKEKEDLIAKITKITVVTKNRKDSIQQIDKKSNEIRTLNNSNLLKIYDYFTNGLYICIITEYCYRNPLSHAIAKRKEENKKFSVNQVLEILMQLLNGLLYLHKKCMTLHYLNTDDILIKYNKLKISNVDREAEKLKFCSVTSAQFGKIGFYFPPEKNKTGLSDSLSQTADMWSLGCILFEICKLEAYTKNKPLPNVYSKYSLLNDAFNKMMHEDPTNRISSEKLMHEIVNHNSYIYPNADLNNMEQSNDCVFDLIDEIENLSLSNQNDVYISFCVDDSSKIPINLAKFLKNLDISDTQRISVSKSPLENDEVSENELIKRITQCSLFIACINKAYSQSGHCMKEFTLAKRSDKNIIILKMEHFENLEFEYGLDLLIEKYNKYPAYSYDPQEEFKKQWVWFDYFLLTVILIKKFETPGIEVNLMRNSASNATAAISKNYSHDIFISHKWIGSSPSRPSELIIDLYKKLTKELNIKVWLDVVDIPFGADLLTCMENGIKNSKICLICLSNGYDESVNCLKEIGYANSIKKPFVVLFMEKINVESLKNGVGLAIGNSLRFNAYKYPSKNEWNNDDFKKLIADISNIIRDKKKT